MTGRLPGDCTTDKRPALFLASIFYDTGYSNPDDCRYRRPAMLELLRLNSYLPPFQRANVQAQKQSHYSVFNVLKFFVFSFIIQQKVKLRYLQK
jgi:hypothetical protein